ncbi:MAG: hypothetical protein U0V54_09445 [Saprospiraceae bacterium]|nr:hypothetical protein [Saprospiraceae bacterium]
MKKTIIPLLIFISLIPLLLTGKSWNINREFAPTDTTKIKPDTFYNQSSFFSYNKSAFNDKAGSLTVQVNSLVLNSVTYTPSRYLAIGAGIQFIDDAGAFFYIKPSLPLNKNFALGAMFLSFHSDGKFYHKLAPQLSCRTRQFEYTVTYLPKVSLMHNLRVNFTAKKWIGFELWNNQESVNFGSITFNWNFRRSSLGLGIQAAEGFEYRTVLPCIQYRYFIL